jgi:hypothetical protein
MPLPMPLSGELPEPNTDMPTTPEGYWDQFDENRRLFGTTSTWDPSMSAYTTPLVIESLTPAQIAKAEELARVPLPSERLESTRCTFCSASFANTSALIDHVRSMVLKVLANEEGCCEEAARTLKSILKRKSWIVAQETLPVGLVSQIESLYKRQITSSTNLQMMLEAVRDTSDAKDDTKTYLLNELVSVVLSQAPAEPAAAKPAQKIATTGGKTQKPSRQRPVAGK